MPIINRDDAAEVDEHIARVFVAAPSSRAEALRTLFVEKLDFAPATGYISLGAARRAVVLPAQAERLATMEGVTAVFVSLNLPDSDQVRRAEAAEAARLIANELAGDLFLVMTNRRATQIHFIYPTFEGAKPYLRRLVIERHLSRRTAVQQLSNIYWNWNESGSIHQALEKVFDVEAVTADFFKEYKRIFDHVMDKVRGFGRGEEETEAKKLFVQTLFNRLMFVYFISRKGWLTYEDDNNYLNALWRAYKASPDYTNFYADRLRLLFFAGLCGTTALRAGLPSVLYAVLGEVVDGLLNVRDAFGIFVRDLQRRVVGAELLLERHDQLHQVQRVGVEIVRKRSGRNYLGRVDAELVRYHLLYPLHNCRHCQTSMVRYCIWSEVTPRPSA